MKNMLICLSLYFCLLFVTGSKEAECSRKTFKKECMTDVPLSNQKTLCSDYKCTLKMIKSCPEDPMKKFAEGYLFYLYTRIDDKVSCGIQIPHEQQVGKPGADCSMEEFEKCKTINTKDGCANPKKTWECLESLKPYCTTRRKRRSLIGRQNKYYGYIEACPGFVEEGLCHLEVRENCTSHIDYDKIDGDGGGKDKDCACKEFDKHYYETKKCIKKYKQACEDSRGDELEDDFNNVIKACRGADLTKNCKG